MLYVLLGFCVLLMGYASWISYQKIHVANIYRKKWQQRKLKKPAAIRVKKPEEVQDRIILVEEYEQQLFDDAATLFMHEPRSNPIRLEDANVLQAELLKKMPAKTLTQIRQLDLAEWSIYWTFFEQSLECYIGRYGVFYTHVDRWGKEHQHILAFNKLPDE